MKRISSKYRLYLRRKNKIRNILANSMIKKYIIYIRRSNKHFYVSVHDGPNVLVSCSTLTIPRDNQYLRNMIPVLFNNFCDRVKEKLGLILPENIIYNIGFHACKGNIRTFIDLFNKALHDNKNIKITTSV